MSRRATAAPPRLAGYIFLRNLGSGGFADVYLYEDVRTSREVAIKVLLADSLSPGVRDQFESEARLMGRLSTHPSIVTIYNTGIAPDGRPYLVMEYCSEPNLGDRFRTSPLDLPRAVDVIVEICGAVETAHRAGILHRDIKPANILVSDYGKAMLTDFGIAGALGGDGDTGGLSVPWAPPEFVEGDPGGRESDVWSLAATLYSLLEGRAPFEIPGQDRSARAQMARIVSEPLPPMRAPGVPAVLEQTLAAAMAKDPHARIGTALEFGNALRRVQASLRLPESTLLVRSPRSSTHVETGQSGAGATGATAGGSQGSVPAVTASGASWPGSTSVPGADDSADGTVLRAQSIDPDVPSQPGPPVSSGRFVPGDHVHTPHPAEPAADTLARGSTLAPTVGPNRGAAPSAPAAQPTAGTRGRRGAIVAAALVAAVAIVGVVGWAVLGGDDDNDDGTGAHTPETVAAAPRAQTPPREQVPAVTDARGELRVSEAVFTWTNPDPQPGDRFLWSRTGTGTVETPIETSETTVTIDGEPGTCIEVSLVRESGRTSADGVEVCAG